MQNLYLKTSASPLPRPLLAHYPRKSSEDFWKHVNYGFPKGVSFQSRVPLGNEIEVLWKHGGVQETLRGLIC